MTVHANGEVTIPNKQSIIKLIWADGHYRYMFPLCGCRGMSNKGERPISFEWINPKVITVNLELIEWIHSEFQPMFHKDAFLWKVSTHTAPKELQCHLHIANSN